MTKATHPGPVSSAHTGGVIVRALSIDKYAYALMQEMAPTRKSYGNFLSAVIKFIFVAFVLFIAVKGINKMKKAEAPAAPAATPEDIQLLREIRDSLKK